MANANAKSVEKTIASLIRNTNVDERVAEIATDRTVQLTDMEIKSRAFDARIDELGALAGAAKEALFDVAIAFQQAVRDGIRSADDAVKVYTRYSGKSAESAAARDKANGFDASLAGPDAKSFASQVSTLKGYAHKAVVALGSQLYKNIDAAQMTIPPEMRKHSGNVKAYKAINAAVARLAKKEGNLTRTANIVMAKDMAFLIGELMRSDADGDGTGDSESKSPLSPLQKLGNLAKSLDKLSKDGFQDDQRVIDVAAYIAQLHAILTVESKNVGSLPALR